MIVYSREQNEAAIKLDLLKRDFETMGGIMLDCLRHPEATDADAKVLRTAYADAYKRFKESEQAFNNLLRGA